jgi:hypothetical protein
LRVRLRKIVAHATEFRSMKPLTDAAISCIHGL